MKTSQLIILIIALSGCIHGPKDKRVSAVSALNGENYGTAVGVGPIPVYMERKLPTIQLKGLVVVGHGINRVGLKNEIVELRDQKTIIAQATTNTDGEFEMNGTFPEGTYTLELQSKNYHGKAQLSMSEIHPPVITIEAKKKTSAGK